MSHQPECPKTTQREYSAEACPACSLLRIAYKRGREDAAADVALLVKEYPKKHNDITFSFLKRADAIDAARGGEQA